MTVVLDASVLIAHLTPGDPHRHAAGDFLRTAQDDLLIHTVTLAEVLVFPSRERRVDEALGVLADIGVEEVPFPPGAARVLAELRALHGLKMPDCCVLLTAMDRRAALASFDDRLRRVALDHEVRLAFG